MTNRDIVFTLKFKNQAAATMRKFSGQLKGMGAAAAKASKGLKRLGNAFKRVADKAAAAGRKLQAAGARIREAGTQMTFALGAPLALAIGFTVKKFADLELAMAGVQKTVGGTPETIEKLKDEFIEMSNAMPTAATELARIGQVAGQLGIEADNIGTFTDTIAKMGAATDLSTERAAFALARVSNIMGTPQSAANNLASAIVDLGNNFAATEPEITEFALRIAGAGKVVGLSEGDVLGFSAALASVGVRAQAGGTAISRAFIKMANEVSKGGAKVAQFAEVAGMSTQDFAKAFKDDAAGALQTFILGLGKAQEAGVNVFQTLEDLGLSEIRTRDAMLRLSLSGDLLARSLNTGNKAFEEGTALNKEYAIFLDTTASRMKILWQQIENAAALMGKAFEPIITRVIGRLSEFAMKAQEWARSLKDMSDSTKTTIVALMGLVIAGGPALIFIGAFTQLIGFAIVGLKAFAVQAKRAFVFFLTNPLGLFILALGAVIALLVKFKDQLFTVGDDTARLQDYLVAIWDVIYAKIKWVGENVVALWAHVSNETATAFSGTSEQISSDFLTAFDVIRSIGNAIIQLFQIVGQSIGAYMSISFNWMTDLAKLFFNSIKTSASVIMKLLRGDWQGAWEEATAPLKTNPMDNMTDGVRDAMADVKAILVSDPLGDIFAGIGEAAGKRYQEFLAKGFEESDALEKTMAEVAEKMSKDPKIEASGGEFAKLFNKGFTDAMDEYIGSARDIAKQTEDAFTNAFQGIEDGLMEFLETGKFSFKEFANSIISDFARIGVKSLLGDAMSLLKGGDSAEGGFASGLGDLFGGTQKEGEEGKTGGLMGLVGGGLSALGGLFGIGGDKVEGATPGEQAIVDELKSQKEGAAGLFDGLGDKISTGWTGLKDAFSTGLDSLGSTMSSLFSSIGGLFGGGGGGGSSTGDTVAGVVGLLASFASEGGISQSLSKKGMVPASSFANARRFAEGGVTSGTDRIPAMLSPNEAVIPLSRNRAVPIEGNMGGATTVNISVQANDVESFKQSQSQMLARFGTAVIRARRKTQ